MNDAFGSPPHYHRLDELQLIDLEAVRLLLRGESVIDWHRLHFDQREDALDFIAAQEFNLSNPADLTRIEAVKQAAISYLRRNFDFPIPKPVAEADLIQLLMLASSKGHRQLCACTILKVIHIIHHLEARELLYMLPTSDQEVFQLVEQKVYRIIGNMLARGLPIVEFIGGRKNKDSLYTKLLSKPETIAAQIYDKVRFRVVTRTADDAFPVLAYLMWHLFPFNYVIPGQSTNTMFDFRTYCRAHPRLRELFPQLQLSSDLDDEARSGINPFSATNYRVVHFVVDMPVRLPDSWLAATPPATRALGPVIFVQTEFQLIDRETEHANELGEASHSSYKERQKLAVMRRLKLGSSGNKAPAVVTQPPLRVVAPTKRPPPPRRKKT